ncbi:hypothetical protein GF360_00890 [candidate division WWE3 bacterium]|nr:hypothetical protein [candidate division WWE3 bacterium]
MIYQITSDNLKLSESMKTLAENKVSKLEKYFPNTDEDLVISRVVLNKGSEEDTFVSKVELEVAGKLYYGDETDYSMESAVIGAVEAIERQVEKERGKQERDWEKRREMKVTSSEEEEMAAEK